MARTPAASPIGRLRRKLGDPPVIATKPGVGYRIAGPATPLVSEPLGGKRGAEDDRTGAQRYHDVL